MLGLEIFRKKSDIDIDALAPEQVERFEQVRKKMKTVKSKAEKEKIMTESFSIAELRVFTQYMQKREPVKAQLEKKEKKLSALRAEAQKPHKPRTPKPKPPLPKAGGLPLSKTLPNNNLSVVLNQLEEIADGDPAHAQEAIDHLTPLPKFRRSSLSAFERRRSSPAPSLDTKLKGISPSSTASKNLHEHALLVPQPVLFPSTPSPTNSQSSEDSRARGTPSPVIQSSPSMAMKKMEF